MNTELEYQDKILSQVGIKREMRTLPSSWSFSRYVTDEYRNSERRETDEAYNMFEFNLLHNVSGLRLTFTRRESNYSDTVEYKVIRYFIITLLQKQHEILDADFDKKIFMTDAGEIHFSETSKET